MKKLLSVGTAVAFSTVLAANAEASEQDHKVESGETLSEIAALNETTVSALKEANDLSSDLILPGQVLQVTDEVAEDAEETDGVYVIQPGDTLFEIAVEFDLTVKELMNLNNLSSDLIVAGNELVVSADAVSEEVQVAAPQVVEEPVVQEEEVVEEQQPVAQEAPAEEEVVVEENNNNNYDQAAAEQAAAEQAAAEEAAAQEAEQQQQQQEEPQQEVQTQNQSAAPSSNNGLNWGALAACESGGNASIVSSNGKYHGLYQFDAQTWQSVGGSGVASQASAAEQTQRAQQLYSDRGSQPWPVCGSRL